MLNRKIFGLDISDHSIEALMLKKRIFGKPKVYSYARSILRSEIVSNGIIKDAKKLEENIVKLIYSAKPRLFRTPYCILSLPESQIFTAIFKLPAGLRHDEIKKTIPYKAEEVIPFESTEIYFDFKVIKKQGATQEVFYAAVLSKVVDSYVRVLKNVGLKPVAFDLESVSLAKALLKNGKKLQGKILLDIGARTSNLSIFDQSGIRQSLIIKVAGNRFTKAVAKGLGIAEKLAEEQKIKNGLDEKNQKPKALTALKSELNKIISEVKKVVDYYQLENQRQIDEVILAGGSALMPGIEKYFFDSLKIKTSIGNPFLKISAGRFDKLKNYGVMFSNVCGLALRGINKKAITSDINLLPFPARRLELMPEKSNFKAWIPFYIRLIILIILIFVLGGIFYLKSIGVDFYNKVFPTETYESKITPDFDMEVIDQLRQRLNSTSTEALINENNADKTEEIKIEKMVKVKDTPAGTLNVRQGPATSYDLVGKVTPGQELKFIEEQNGWYKIIFEGTKEGWVIKTYADIIEVNVNQNQQPLPEVKGVSIQLDKIKISNVDSGFLNVRSQPGIENEKIGKVMAGQEFEVLAEVEGWYKIEYTEDKYGWVSSEFASPIENNN